MLKKFKEDDSVRIWYGKNREGELEYFSSQGLHPQTGKTLKPITRYMIEKYICNRDNSFDIIKRSKRSV